MDAKQTRRSFIASAIGGAIAGAVYAGSAYESAATQRAELMARERGIDKISAHLRARGKPASAVAFRELKAIQLRMRWTGTLSRRDTGRVLAVTNSPADPIVKAAAMSTLIAVARSGGLSVSDHAAAAAAALAGLRSPEWLVRDYSCGLLRELRADPARAVPALLPLLHDPQPAVQRQARSTLSKLGYS